MRLIVQKVSRASVEVEGKVVGEIKNGLMVLCGICDTDTEKVNISLVVTIPSHFHLIQIIQFRMQTFA